MYCSLKDLQTNLGCVLTWTELRTHLLKGMNVVPETSQGMTEFVCVVLDQPQILRHIKESAQRPFMELLHFSSIVFWRHFRRIESPGIGSGNAE